MVIGITGGICSGKSHICNLFSYKCGIDIIDTDSIVKSTLMYYIPIVTQTIKIFGDDSYIDGRLNQEKFYKTLYSNPDNLTKMNNIVVPYLIEYIKNISEPNKNIILECPILFNTDIYKLVDYSILVVSDMNSRIERLRMRYDDDILIMNKINYQSFDESKANYILKNNNKIESQIEKLIKQFNI